MATSELLWLIAALLVGGVLGVFYFGGLWWTVQRIPQARRAGLLLLASFAARAVITLLGLYLIAGGRWERLLAAVTGLILVRVVLVRILGRAPAGEKTEETNVETAETNRYGTDT
jgi:F1F0 ATPase subunit 2